MHRRGIINDKSGESIVMPEVIFIIVNLLFFLAIIYFVNTSSKGALAYEQVYAKQIALAIDSGKPYTQISINFEKALGITKGSTDNIVSFNNNEVIVNLGGKGGYGFKYFSDYEIEHFFAGKELVITLKEKK
ncbi:MAG: hypothetical protein AABW63_02655 [Nanoarchaeota archaeon]